MPRLSAPSMRIDTRLAPGAMPATMPAQAVPWPTRSRASGSSTTSASSPSRSTRRCRATRPRDGGMIAVDARVDDRDGHALPIRVAEHVRAIQAAERWIDVARSPSRRSGRERLAPRRQRDRHGDPIGVRARRRRGRRGGSAHPASRSRGVRVRIDVAKAGDAVGDRPRRIVVVGEPGCGAGDEGIDRRRVRRLAASTRAARRAGPTAPGSGWRRRRDADARRGRRASRRPPSPSRRRGPAARTCRHPCRAPRARRPCPSHRSAARPAASTGRSRSPPRPSARTVDRPRHRRPPGAARS